MIPPKQNADFVAHMEDVLEVYKRPYDPKRPVVCMDEQPTQLLKETKECIPASPGRPAREDYVYERNGVTVKFMFTEALGGWRKVNVRERKTASFYEAFEPAEARRLIERLEIHYPPRHGSWLDVAEIELSVFTKQCLDRRIPDIETLREESKAWYCQRNAGQKSVDGQFTTEKARIKLKRLYPQIHISCGI